MYGFFKNLKKLLNYLSLYKNLKSFVVGLFQEENWISSESGDIADPFKSIDVVCDSPTQTLSNIDNDIKSSYTVTWGRDSTCIFIYKS